MHFHNCPSLSGNFGSWDGTAGYSLGICSPQMCRRCPARHDKKGKNQIFLNSIPKTEKVFFVFFFFSV